MRVIGNAHRTPYVAIPVQEQLCISPTKRLFPYHQGRTSVWPILNLSEGQPIINDRLQGSSLRWQIR